jgi:hypothetical protein
MNGRFFSRINISNMGFAGQQSNDPLLPRRCQCGVQLGRGVTVNGSSTVEVAGNYATLHWALRSSNRFMPLFSCVRRPGERPAD